jgi:dienelactone hydrolase
VRSWSVARTVLCESLLRHRRNVRTQVHEYVGMAYALVCGGHSAQRLACPVIFFQGLEDRVIPPEQAQGMVETLRQKGVRVAYVAFAGEEHGFRCAENIQRALEAELFFYAQAFGFEPADAIEPVVVANH